MPITMINQILKTCKQLNRLLKRKDPYHADMVDALLRKIELSVPSDNRKVDKDVIIESLNDSADR